MARIKTALEIAMEKLGNIEVDEKKLRRERLRTEARTLIGSFLADDMMDIDDLEKRLSKYGQDDMVWVKQTANSTILQNLVLPAGAEYKGRNLRLRAVFDALNQGSSDAAGLLSQAMGLEDRYWDTMNGLLDKLKEQYLQAYDGAAPEQDKEFLKLYQTKAAQVSGQFRQALNQTKERLARLLGIA